MSARALFQTLREGASVFYLLTMFDKSSGDSHEFVFRTEVERKAFENGVAFVCDSDLSVSHRTEVEVPTEAQSAIWQRATAGNGWYSSH